MRIAVLPRAVFFASVFAIAFAAHGAEEAAHSMSGCLRQGAAPGSYELTDLGLADGPPRVIISAASVALAGHVGHKVELTGTTVQGADPASHTMSISALKHLAASCP